MTPASRYAAKFSKSTAAYKLDSVKFSAAKVISILALQPRAHSADMYTQDFHKVTTLPTVIAFKDGKEFKRATNEAERKELAATLSS